MVRERGEKMSGVEEHFAQANMANETEQTEHMIE